MVEAPQPSDGELFTRSIIAQSLTKYKRDVNLAGSPGAIDPLPAGAAAGMLCRGDGRGRAMDIGWERRGKRAGAAEAPVIPLQQFFATAPVPCPYLPGRAERKLIVELSGRTAPIVYDELSRAGFRRSHRFAYRPACRSCAACVPVRIAVERFSHTRSTRRVRNLNAGLNAGLNGGADGALAGRILAPRATVEQFRLFAAYQHSRHRDSDMAAMSYDDYRQMVEDSAVRSAIVELREPGGALVAVSLIDRLDDGVSAVYSFFDPERERASLGTWSILWLVEECRRAGLPYVYLGYWVAGSPKMAYKARFPALERLTDGSWIPFTAGPTAKK
jgi:leucyl-tRNA---protein transferase